MKLAAMNIAAAIFIGKWINAAILIGRRVIF